MSRLKKISAEMKEEMRNDYRAGVSLDAILRAWEIKSISTLYYHLKPLTKEDRITRIQNKK